MAVTPLWVATGEVRDSVEFQTFAGTPAASSDDRSFTGGRSCRSPGTTSSVNEWGKVIPASTHLRMGYRLNYSGIAGAVSTVLWPLLGQFTDVFLGKTILSINRRASDDNIIPIVNGVQQSAIGTLSSIGLGTVNAWYHIGLICEIGEPGYAAFLVNNLPVWSYTGDITGEISRIEFRERSGGSSVNSRWNVAYFDDIYADDITGEPNDSPPAYRFPVRIANAAGEDAAWDSTGANNYEAVDENPHDGDTTYNYVETNAAKDTFAASSMGAFAGHTIVARHPYVIARRTGDEGQIKLHTFDGVNYLSGAAQNLGTDYSVVMDTQTTMPDGTTPFSTEAALDATEIGYESAGFS